MTDRSGQIQQNLGIREIQPFHTYLVLNLSTSNFLNASVELHIFLWLNSYLLCVFFKSCYTKPIRKKIWKKRNFLSSKLSVFENYSFFKNILNSDQILTHVKEENISKFVASRFQNTYIKASRFHFWNLLATNLLTFRYITCIRIGKT